MLVVKTLYPAQVLLCALTALNTTPASAQSSREGNRGDRLNVVSREERYEVEGERLEQVVEVLNGMRLEGDSGPFSQGLTEYRVVPHWTFDANGEGCGTTAVTVDVDITLTLPRWRAAAHAREVDQRRWSEILLRITRHEYRHRDITIEVATELLEDLERLRAGTCTGVRRAAEARLALAEAELEDRHAAFDSIDGRGRGP